MSTRSLPQTALRLRLAFALALAFSLSATHSLKALDLLGYWDFNDNSNPVVAPEVSGNSPDANLGGPAVFSADGAGYSGIPGDRSLDLGGVNNGARAQVPAGSHLDAAFNNNAMAVSVWQFNTGIGNTSTFWVRSPTAGANVRGFQAHVPWSDGTIYFDHAGCCGGTQRITAGGQIQVNRWQHFVFQKDAAGQKQIWVDGNLITDQASGAAALLAFDGQVSIGAEFASLNSFGGRIDEFAIFDDVLTPAQITALAAGASPPELFFAANDDAGATDADKVLTKLTPSSSTSIAGFTNAADLDFQGDFVYAVNARGPGGFSIGDADFTIDTAPGVTLSAEHEILNWQNPSFGATPDDDNLEIVMQSIRWSSAPEGLSVDLAGLNAGDTYKLQLLFYEANTNRGFDVEIEGTQVVDDFKNPSAVVPAAVITHTFVAGDPTLNIVLNGVNTPFPDKNPVLQGLTLELCETSLLANDYGGPLTLLSADTTSALGAAVSANSDGTFSYDPTGVSSMQALPGGVMVTDSFTYTAFASGPASPPEVTSTGSGGTVLGAGSASLLGGDLTDVDDIHNEGAYNPPTDFGGFDATFSGNDEAAFGGGEFAFNVFDNAVGGGSAKWCCNTAGPTTPDGAGLWVAAQFAQPYVLTHFTITSSNDSPQRDPRVWAIEGSNDGSTWTPIFAYSNTGAAPFTARNQVLLYTASGGRTDLTGGTTHFESSTAYLYFRYFVDSTGAATGAAHALNELEFFGQPAPTASATVTVKVTGVNDAPDANDDATGTDENTLVNTLTTGGPTSLLDNDTDPDTGETAILEVVNVDGNPLGTHGTTGESVVITTSLGAQLTVNDDGTFSYDPTGSSVLQALGQGTTVVDMIDYTVSDGNGTLPLGGVSGDLALWLDGSDLDADGTPDVLVDGAAVTGWLDKSGHGRDASGVLGTPFYVASSAASPAGAPAVGFSSAGGTDQLFTSYNFDNLGANYTIFAVSRYTGGDNERVVTSKTRNWLFGHHGNLDERWYAEGWIRLGGTNNNVDLHVYTGIIGPDVNGNASDPGADFWRDGVQLENDNQGSNNTAYKPGAIALGAWAGGGESSNAEVAEVIIYDRALSDAERLAVEDYLNTKYFGSGLVSGSDTATLAVTVTGVNDVPDADDDNYSTDEDTVVNVDGNLNLLQLDAVPTGDYPVSADGESFRAHVDHDGTNGWLLIGRGRNGWLFDNNATTGQQTPDDVRQGLGTPGAFAPAHLRDNIVIDLLNAAGVDMADVEIRLRRAGDNAGTGDYQEVIWSNFTGKGGVFSWDLDDGPYGVTTDYLNAPAGLPGAQTGSFGGKNTRDSEAGGNDGDRIFTWPWGGHGSQQGFSYGQAVNNGANNATSYFWEIGNENHAIPYTEVYIRVTSTPEPAGLLLNDSDLEVDGGNPDQVLEILSAGPSTGSENVLPDTEALTSDPPAGVDSVSFTTGLGATVTVYDDGGFDYDPTGALQSLAAGQVVMDSFLYVVTDNDPVSPQTSAATATITVTGQNDAPEVTPPGIPDLVIFTSNPNASVPLFPHFEDVDNNHDDDDLTYTVTMNSNGTLIQTSPISSVDGILDLETPCTLVGTADITVEARDPDGLFVTDTFTVTVKDDVPPVFTGAKDKVYSVAAGANADASAHFAGIAAADKVDGPVAHTCTLAGGGPLPAGNLFPVGVHPIECTAQDSASPPNVTTVSFNIIVLEIQSTPGVRFFDVVSLRGDGASGAGVPAGATISVVRQAFLNNNDEVIYSATLAGGGSNNAAVFTGTLLAQTAIATKNTASAGGNYGNFSNLSLNDAADASFQSQIGSTPGQFLDSGGGPALAALKGGLAPTGGGELFGTLQKPALASSGELLTRANLIIGTGAGVTIGDDTLITSSAGTVLVREGDPSSVSVTAYDQIHPRIVASEDNDHYAFSAFLLEDAGFDPLDNTGVFTGALGGGLPALVARENDPAPGIPGATLKQFLGEAVNSSGDLAIRCNLAGPGIAAQNNEALYTNSGGALVLVAREGDVAPCLPNNLVAFSRIESFYLGDDGSVCFRAFLKDATATPAVSSATDGSVWRWKDGEMHLVAREGEMANNTDGAVIRTIDGFSCSGAGGITYWTSFVPGLGDSVTNNNLAVYLDRGAADAAPELILRRSDTFDLGGDIRTVVGIKLSSEKNSGGGTGGYGRTINDAGNVLLNLTLSGNQSGIFVLSP